MAKHNSVSPKTISTVDVSKVVIVPGFNIRLSNNLNIASMEETLLADGRIIDPIHLSKKKDGLLKVIRGHRRTLAAQKLLARDDVPEAVKTALKNTPCIIHEGLTDGEEMVLMLDHGNVQGLNRTETALAVRRLMMENPGIREKEIMDRLLQPLAMFSGNMAKLAEVPENPKDREEFLRKWLHGTCGNYIMSALRMGPYVWGQFILTCKAKDRLLETLPDGSGKEKVEMNCDRVRITALSKAKNEDTSTGGWDPEKGGEKFNTLIAKFKAEDAGQAEGEKRTTRPNVSQLRETAGMFSSPAIRGAFLRAAGDEVPGLLEMDESIMAINKVMGFLAEHRESLKGQFRELVDAILASNLDTLKVVVENIVGKPTK